MAELAVIKGPGTLSCLGLGSCIGLAGLDPVSNVSGMVHIMLPEAFPDKPVDKPGKFADTGVEALLKELERAGASRGRLIFAMAGGAQVFKFGSPPQSRMDIGARNSAAVSEQLKRLGLRCVASDTGGNLGRTVLFTPESGHVKVRTVSAGEKLLCSLRA